MLAFDAASYLERVLAPAVKDAAAPDLFARYLLEPGDEDEHAIKLRMDEVKAHWDKLESRNNAKYTLLLNQLISEHTVASLTLLSAVERRGAAEQLRAEADESDRRHRQDREKFEQEVAESVARAGGLTARNRRMLEEFARGLALDPAAVAARLDACPAVVEHADVRPLSDSVRTRIRQTLAAYAAATDTPSLGVSLFHAIGLSGPEHDRATLESNWQRQMAANRSLRFESAAKVPTQNVLGLVKTYLIDQDPAAYVATLVAEAQDALRPRAAAAALGDNAIGELASEQLVREARERGLTSEEARDLVSNLAVDLGVELRLGAIVDYVICASCNRPHPSAGAPEHCTRCGSALFAVCPQCQTRHAASDTACPSCGTDLREHARSLRLMSEARRALQAGAIALAATLAGEVRGVARDADHDKLTMEIDLATKSARSRWEIVEREIADRRLYAASKQLAHLEQTAGDLRGPSGETAAERRVAVTERVRAVEATLARTRQGRPAEQEQGYARALEEVADCREAERQLARIEPLPASAVRANARSGEVVVQWQRSSSPGPLRYRVTRSRDGTPSADTEVAVTAALSVNDPEPPTGERICYRVTAERAGRASRVSCSPPLFIRRELEDLAVAERDGEVRLSWKPVDGNARVEVQRSDQHGEARQLAAGRDGLLDKDVQAGRSYEYRLRLLYGQGDGDPPTSEDRVVFAKPTRRPEPVHDLATERQAGVVRLRCSAPHDTHVLVLRCSEHPQVPEGDELTPADLERLGEQLPLDSAGSYDPDPQAHSWYLPISQSGAYLIAGRAIRYLMLDPIVDVRAVDLTSGVRLTWAWPAQTRAAVVAWRRDRQPSDADDQRAKRVTITQAQYADQGGLEIPTPGTEPVFVAVFAAARLDGEILGASSCDRSARLVVKRSERAEVRYSVRRSGLRRRRVHVEVIEPEQALPQLVLVAKRGELLPRSAEDGSVVASLGGAGDERRCELDLGDLGRPVTIRMFLGPSTAVATHRIRDPDTRELVLR